MKPLAARLLMTLLLTINAALAAPAGDALPGLIRQQVDALAPIEPMTQPISALYGLRDFKPIWNDSQRLDALIGALRGLRDDGLDPDDYGVKTLERGRKARVPKDVAARDVAATRACLLAVSHLYRGKVNPETLDEHWNFEKRAKDWPVSLRALNQRIEGGYVAAMFDESRPQHPFYGALKAALKQLRETDAHGGWPQIASGPPLKPGASDPRVPALRRRLEFAGLLPKSRVKSERDDAGLAAALKQFQDEQYLDADGALGNATRRALNVPVRSRIAQLRVNLERSRWLLPRLTGTFVLVDVAGYKVRFYRDGSPIWTSRVQVGRSLRRTPIFQAKITYLTFNPWWTVPQTVLTEDVLPAVRRDRGYLARHHIRIVDANGDELGAEGLDWSAPDGPKEVWLRQEPGAENSLGRVRINFPNPYDVYMHDTPHTALFQKGQRAFSSGCIRVEDPLALTELLLDDPKTWNRAAIDQIVAEGQTREVGLKRAVPVMVLYWTVDLQEGGRVAFKPDLYELDAPTLRALDQPA